MSDSELISRRAFVGGGLALASGAGGVFLAEQVSDKGRMRVTHQPGAPSIEPPSARVLATLTAYLSACFGRELTEEDRLELWSRMTFAAARNSGWKKEYEKAAEILDSRASAAGAVGYIDASTDVQVKVLRDLRRPLSGALSGLKLAVSKSDAALERMRVSTSRHLIRIYRHSGVPWRHRGYETWPGVPDTVPAVSRLMKV